MEKLNTQKIRDFVQSKNSAMVTTAIAVTAGLSSYTAFADNPLATALQTIGKNFYSLLLTVANPIALICGGLCFLHYFSTVIHKKKKCRMIG